MTLDDTHTEHHLDFSDVKKRDCTYKTLSFESVIIQENKQQINY